MTQTCTFCPEYPEYPEYQSLLDHSIILGAVGDGWGREVECCMACELKYLLNPPLPWIWPWIQSLHHAFMWINLVYFSLGFDDPSALLKHELAYCLGQMQVEFTCIFAYSVQIVKSCLLCIIGPQSFWKLLSQIFLCEQFKMQAPQSNKMYQCSLVNKFYDKNNWLQ